MPILHVWLVLLLACLCVEHVSVREIWLLPVPLRMDCSLLACCSGVVLIVPPLSPWYVLAGLWLAVVLAGWFGSAIAIGGLLVDVVSELGVLASGSVPLSLSGVAAVA